MQTGCDESKIVKIKITLTSHFIRYTYVRNACGVVANVLIHAQTRIHQGET